MNLLSMLEESFFHSYAYSYPHKMAYRELEKPIGINEAWADENTSALFLYLHIPFCEMRCGFCNLFTMTLPETGLVKSYLTRLRREAELSFEALDSPSFARLAVGGGTPTFLNEEELIDFFSILEDVLGVQQVPASFEASPATVNKDKLALLKEKGVTRLSMGIQSIVENEARNLGRPQKNMEVRQAVELIRDTGFEIMNLDLIYGAAGQSADSWKQSLDYVIDNQAEEVYLYPLYVRPLTGLGKRKKHEEDHRLMLYRTGRDRLLENGYEQISMRMFRRKDLSIDPGPPYCCQEDGMLGLGSGARSYTTGLHYSSEYAVGRQGIKEIIQNYVSKSEPDLKSVNFGVRLNQSEQKIRYIIKSVLHGDGLITDRFKSRYGQDVFEFLPRLRELQELDFVQGTDGILRLNSKGLEASDTIGHWLYSPAVMNLIREYELR